MEAKRVEIHLIPAGDDAALDSRAYQAELDTFDKNLRSGGMVPERVLERLEAAAGTNEPAVWLGQFVVLIKALTPIASSAICTALAGYFHAKRGRKVTVEISRKGERIKISAQTPQEVEKLLGRFVTQGQKAVAAKKKPDRRDARENRKLNAKRG
jgi:hypothetical protein